MKEFKEVMQNHIVQPITLDYGCIGTNYQQILIVRENQIVCIGQFLYRIWSELYTFDKKEVTELLVKLAIEAKKYVEGKRETVPSLCYQPNGKLGIKD